MAKKLELNKETLRDLSDASLTQAAGGAAEVTGLCGGPTQTIVCPSGATWLVACESNIIPWI